MSTGSEHASFVLTQHGNTATLRIEHRWSNYMVSMSEGADGLVNSNSDMLQGRDVVVLEGSLTRSAQALDLHATQALDLHFTQVTLETARWMGYGTLPLGPASTGAITLELHCEQASLEVVTSPGVSAPVEALLCHFTSTPPWLTEATATFPLSTREITRGANDEEALSYRWAPVTP